MKLAQAGVLEPVPTALCCWLRGADREGLSKPVSGAYFWCPPLRDGPLDLRQLGL